MINQPYLPNFNQSMNVLDCIAKVQKGERLRVGDLDSLRGAEVKIEDKGLFKIAINQKKTLVTLDSLIESIEKAYNSYSTEQQKAILNALERAAYGFSNLNAMDQKNRDICPHIKGINDFIIRENGVQGHAVVITVLPDGKLQFYDPNLPWKTYPIMSANAIAHFLFRKYYNQNPNAHWNSKIWCIVCQYNVTSLTTKSHKKK